MKEALRLGAYAAGGLTAFLGLRQMTKCDTPDSEVQITSAEQRKIHQRATRVTDLTPDDYLSDEALEKAVPWDCRKEDGSLYVYSDDPRYTNQYFSVINFVPATLSGMNCTAALRERQENEDFTEWMSSLNGTINEMIFHVDGMEVECESDGSCYYSANLESYSQEEADASIQTALDCVMQLPSCADGNPYVWPETYNFTGSSMEEVALQIQAEQSRQAGAH